MLLLVNCRVSERAEPLELLEVAEIAEQLMSEPVLDNIIVQLKDRKRQIEDISALLCKLGTIAQRASTEKMKLITGNFFALFLNDCLL